MGWGGRGVSVCACVYVCVCICIHTYTRPRAHTHSYPHGFHMYMYMYISLVCSRLGSYLVHFGDETADVLEELDSGHVPSAVLSPRRSGSLGVREVSLVAFLTSGGSRRSGEEECGL